MIVRATKKLQELLGQPALVEVEPPLDDWYANLLWLDRRKCVLVTHAGTLFSILAANVRKGDLKPLGAWLSRVVTDALRFEEMPPSLLGHLKPATVKVARTASRQVLGHMNDITFTCRYAVDSAGGLDQLDTRQLNHDLQRLLHNRDGAYIRPIDLARDRLR
jgi:hypothetical protein